MTRCRTKSRAKARNKLRAVARPQEGAALSPCTASLNSASGVSPQVASDAALSEAAPRKLKNGEYPPASEIRALMAQGLSDEMIGRHYQRTERWACTVREMHGIRRRRKSATPPPDQPTHAQIEALVNDGCDDGQLAAHFRRSKGAMCALRNKYGIPPALPLGGHHGEAPRAYGFVPARAAQGELIAERFHAEHRAYPSFSDAQIARFERRWATAHPMRAPVIDIAPALYGDPTPGRAA